MTSGNLFIYFVIALFFLGLPSTGLSAGMGEEVKGTVTKIDGGKVSIKDRRETKKRLSQQTRRP